MSARGFRALVAAIMIARAAAFSPQLPFGLGLRGASHRLAAPVMQVERDTLRDPAAPVSKPVPRLDRRAALLAAGGAIAGAFAQPAFAGFGSMGSAATSSVPLKEMTAEQLETLPIRKASQFQKALVGRRGAKQIDTLLRSIEISNDDKEQLRLLQMMKDELADKMTEEQLARLNQLQARKDKAFRLAETERQLRERAESLAKLAKQPIWVAYVSAFLGSVSSTAIMHPIDTIKTRLQESAARPGAPGAAGPEDGAPVSSIVDFKHPAGGGAPVPRPGGGGRNASGDGGDALDIGNAATGPEPAPGGGGGVALATKAAALEPVPAIGFARAGGDGALPALALDGGGAAAAAAAAQKAAPRGVLDVLRSLKDTEGGLLKGVLDLYEGLLPNLLKEGPSASLYLGIYELVKINLQDKTNLPLLMVYFLSGAAGEIFASLVKVPNEAIKSQVQTSNTTSLEAAQALLRDPKALGNTLRAWQGAMLRDIPMGALTMVFFESSKTYIIQDPYIDWDVSTLQSEALLGSIGGAIGAIASAPMDVITTRIITQKNADGEAPLGLVPMAKRIYSEGGLASFYEGATERLLFWSPAVGIFLAVYCSLRQVAMQAGI